MKGGREWVYIFDAPILTIKRSFLSGWLILMHNHVMGVQERRFGGWACLHIAMQSAHGCHMRRPWCPDFYQ